MTVVSHPEGGNASRIAAAAIVAADGTLFTLPPPARHPSIIALMHSRGFTQPGTTQGFITDGGWFVNRTQAYDIALAAGQLLYDPKNPPLGVTPTPGTLYSEDVW